LTQAHVFAFETGQERNSPVLRPPPNDRVKL
jgi:hypothetical protein